MIVVTEQDRVILRSEATGQVKVIYGQYTEEEIKQIIAAAFAESE